MVHPIALRWSDFDANMHLRHSAYYDFGATARLDFFNEQGLSYDMMQQEYIGLILFREEAIFKREVRPGDKLTINILVTKLRPDYSRFSFRHEIVREDGTVCAIMHVDVAWIDTQRRKLTVPPESVIRSLENAPKSDDFEWDTPKS
jgi:acyl-CoA thioester hydrolase